jgi:hypothetical protein
MHTTPAHTSSGSRDASPQHRVLISLPASDRRGHHQVGGTRPPETAASSDVPNQTSDHCDLDGALGHEWRGARSGTLEAGACCGPASSVKRMSWLAGAFCRKVGYSRARLRTWEIADADTRSSDRQARESFRGLRTGRGKADATWLRNV